MHRRRFLRFIQATAVPLAVGLIAGACAYDPERPLPEGVQETLPCEEPAEYVNLGVRRVGDGYRPTIRISGATVWARLERVRYGRGFAEGIDTYQARLHVLPAGEIPEIDGSGFVTNPGALNLQVHVDGFTQFNVDAGDYFVATNQGAELELLACETGAFIDYPDWMESGEGWPVYDRS